MRMMKYLLKQTKHGLVVLTFNISLMAPKFYCLPFNQYVFMNCSILVLFLRFNQCFLQVVYLCCCRLLEVAGVKKEDTPLTMTLSREVKAVFAEVDDSDITNESAGDSIQPSISEDIVDALKHNPYVDSSVPSLTGSSLMHHAQSFDAVEEISVREDIKHRGKSQLDVDLLKRTSNQILGRRASDSNVTYARDRLFSDYKPILPSVHRVKLEPIELPNRKPNKKRRKGKKLRSVDAESSVDSTAGDGIAEMNSFSSSLKRNAEQSAANDRIQVAKCLASSACADSSVQNRVERIKVSM